MARHRGDRLAIDRLRRLKTERDAYIGPWLPEPIVGPVSTPVPAPDHWTSPTTCRWRSSRCWKGWRPRSGLPSCSTTCSTWTTAHASVIGRSEPACRQVIHRARGRVRGERKRFETTEAAKTALLERFLAAMEASDEQALLAMFAPDATWTADGGGKTPASPRPILGVEPIVSW